MSDEKELEPTEATHKTEETTPEPEEKSDELSDGELENVAGGRFRVID